MCANCSVATDSSDETMTQGHSFGSAPKLGLREDPHVGHAGYVKDATVTPESACD